MFCFQVNVHSRVQDLENIVIELLKSWLLLVVCGVCPEQLNIDWKGGCCWGPWPGRLCWDCEARLLWPLTALGRADTLLLPTHHSSIVSTGTSYKHWAAAELLRCQPLHWRRNRYQHWAAAYTQAENRQWVPAYIHSDDSYEDGDSWDF